MRLGVFYQLPMTAPQTAVDRYQETIDQIRHADRLGFDTVWLAEGHFRPTFSILPGPLILAAALAPVTERIRLGTASIQLPLHHPLRIAEEAAMVDLLSGGRLEFGIGRGSSLPNAEAYGLEWASRDQRFIEQMAIIDQAWRLGSVTYQGEHYRYDNLAVYPRPLQQPLPPIHITANHPAMATFTGAQGLNLLMGVAIHHFPVAYADHIERYVAAFQPTATGRPRPHIGAVFWVFPGRDRAAVEELMRPTMANNHLSSSRTFDEVADGFGIFGSVADCIERIRTIRERAPLDELICHFNPGGLLPSPLVKEAMSRFVHEVWPAVNATPAA